MRNCEFIQANAYRLSEVLLWLMPPTSSSPPDSGVWRSLDVAGYPQARIARSRSRGGPLSAAMFGAFLRGKRNDSELAQLAQNRVFK